MGRKPSKGLNMAKAAFDKRNKSRLTKHENDEVQSSNNLIGTVADTAAETVEFQNALKEQNDANVLSAITSAFCETVAKNPLGNLMIQMQRNRALKKAQNANCQIADQASDLVVTGAIGTSIWMVKKINMVLTQFSGFLTSW